MVVIMPCHSFFCSVIFLCSLLWFQRHSAPSLYPYVVSVENAFILLASVLFMEGKLHVVTHHHIQNYTECAWTSHHVLTQKNR